MTALHPKRPYECTPGSDIPIGGHDQPDNDQRTNPLRTDRKPSQGSRPVGSDGPKYTPRTWKSCGAACIVLMEHPCTLAEFDAPPGMIERRCARDGRHHEVGKNHSIILE